MSSVSRVNCQALNELCALSMFHGMTGREGKQFCIQGALWILASHSAWGSAITEPTWGQEGLVLPGQSSSGLPHSPCTTLQGQHKP